MPMNKRVRDLNWDDYGISKDRYDELRAFCRQYEEKKKKIKYGLPAVKFDGMPRGTGVSNQTEGAAIQNEELRRDCQLIEEAAIRANPSIYRHILRSVTKNIPYEMVEYDHEYGRIPVGKTDFNGYRRLFYFNLHLLKNGFKLSDIM